MTPAAAGSSSLADRLYRDRVYWKCTNCGTRSSEPGSCKVCGENVALFDVGRNGYISEDQAKSVRREIAAQIEREKKPAAPKRPAGLGTCAACGGTHPNGGPNTIACSDSVRGGIRRPTSSPPAAPKATPWTTSGPRSGPKPVAPTPPPPLRPGACAACGGVHPYGGPYTVACGYRLTPGHVRPPTPSPPPRPVPPRPTGTRTPTRRPEPSPPSGRRWWAYTIAGLIAVNLALFLLRRMEDESSVATLHVPPGYERGAVAASPEPRFSPPVALATLGAPRDPTAEDSAPSPREPTQFNEAAVAAPAGRLLNPSPTGASPSGKRTKEASGDSTRDGKGQPITGSLEAQSALDQCRDHRPDGIPIAVCMRASGFEWRVTEGSGHWKPLAALSEARTPTNPNAGAQAVLDYCRESRPDGTSLDNCMNARGLRWVREGSLGYWARRD